MSNTIGLKISSSLFSSNNTGSQLNGVLEAYVGDLSSCLGNCSNQGICVLSNQKYICQCNQYRTGVSCQSNTRPCSSSPCLNNGSCSNTNNDTSFQCKCQNDLFYGAYCEFKLDLCLNSTNCIRGQGICQMNDTQTSCKCCKGYSGQNCEIISNSLLVKKSIISVTTILAIIIMVSYVIMIVCFDFTKYFSIRKRNKIKTRPN